MIVLYKLTLYKYYIILPSISVDTILWIHFNMHEEFSQMMLLLQKRKRFKLASEFYLNDIFRENVLLNITAWLYPDSDGFRMYKSIIYEGGFPCCFLNMPFSNCSFLFIVVFCVDTLYSFTCIWFDWHIVCNILPTAESGRVWNVKIIWIWNKPPDKIGNAINMTSDVKDLDKETTFYGEHLRKIES